MIFPCGYFPIPVQIDPPYPAGVLIVWLYHKYIEQILYMWMSKFFIAFYSCINCRSEKSVHATLCTCANISARQLFRGAVPSMSVGIHIFNRHATLPSRRVVLIYTPTTMRAYFFALTLEGIGLIDKQKLFS